MKITKKIISLFLAILMVTTAFPLSVFAEDDKNMTTDTDVEYEANNAVGSIILDEFAEDETEEESDYAINSVTVAEKTAIAEVTYADSCTLVIAIYDDDCKQMYCSAKENLTVNKETETDESDSGLQTATIDLEFDIEDMPQYFYLKAFMLNADNEPLCDYYYNNEYTQQFEEFMSKTTADFDEDKIINIDESTDNNFLVVSDESVVIEPEEGKNEVVSDDYQNGVYIIENADEQIKDLENGEIFFYQYGDGNDDYIITKVGDTEIDGDTVTVTADTDIKAEDLFSYVKIYIESSDTTFDPTGMDDEIIHEEIPQTNENARSNNNESAVTASVKNKFSFFDYDLKITDGVKVTISGYVDFSASVTLKCYLDKNEDIECIEFYVEYSTEISVSISGEVSTQIPLGYLGIDLKILTAKIGPNFIVKLTVAEFEATFAMIEGEFGFSYDSDNGFENINKKPEVSYDPEIKTSTSIFIGIGVSAETNALYVLQAEASIQAGLDISAERVFSNDKSEEHGCDICLDGNVAIKVTGKIEVKLFKFVKWQPVGFEINVNITKFYYSTNLGLGLGICPNRRFRITFTVKDSDGNLAPDITVYEKDNTENQTQTNSGGKAELYIKNGKAEVCFSDAQGNVYTRNINVTKSKEIDIKLDFEYSEGTDSDDENTDTALTNPSGEMASGTCGDNLTWTLYNDGELVISGTGAMYGWNYISRVPWYSYCTSVKSVVIEKGVTTIGVYAFEDCPSLESVTIPDSITTIGDYAFWGCSRLESVTIPDSVTTIGDWSFEYCNSLESITIGNSVTTIDNYAFYHCPSLESITVDENNQYYSNDEYGVLFNQDKTELIQYPASNNRTDYTIPGSVTTIVDYAFSHSKRLESVTIPDSVTTIGDLAFEYCTSLESVTIPDSVTTIGDLAFEYCTSIESITVDVNNQYYSSDEYGVLFNKDKTELIQYPAGNGRTAYTIPDSVTTIGDSSFRYCTRLKSVTIPDSVTTIDEYAFCECTRLESVIIGNNVTTIGDSSFEGCMSLESITIPDSVTTIGYGAFNNCTRLESVIIGNNVTTIGSFAFLGCTNLASITIPDSVTTIGNGAFKNCTSLKTVYYSGTESQWSEISIGSYNDSLTNATIVYNSSGSAKARSMSYPVNYLAAAEETAMNTAVTSAVIGNEYVMLIVRDENAEDLLAPENLIYIDQKTADSEELTFEFYTDETDYSILFYSSALTHYHNYTAVVTAATCTEQGFTSYTCSCGDSYTDNYVDATGHNYETVVTAATCTEQGFTSYTCSCGDSYVDNYIDATGHNYEPVVTAATCTEQGYTTYTCSCGDSYVDNYVDATGHNYETVVTAATCTEQGFTTYTCSCGDSYTDNYVDATGHNYEPVVTAATCTEQGFTSYTCSCGDSYTDNYVDATGHNYEAIVTEPTCTEPGITVYTCTVCADSYLGDTIAATGHVDTDEDEDEICDICGESLTTDDPGDAPTFNDNGIFKDGCAYTISPNGQILTNIPAGTTYGDIIVNSNAESMFVCVYDVIYPIDPNLNLTYANASEEEKNEYILSEFTTEIQTGDIIQLLDKDGNEIASFICEIENESYVDYDGDGFVTSDDAIFFLKFTMLPQMYIVKSCIDFDGDGYITSDDAIYLLKYTMLPDMYPIY